MAFDYFSKYRRPVQGGATQAVNRAGGEWIGRVDITSVANNLVTVSCAVVGSADHIQLTTRLYGTGNAETVQFHGFCVRTVSPGVGFQIAPVCSLGALVSSYAAYWTVTKLA